ncbi:MAG: VOC family protein [Polyangia bacterium]
MAVKPIPDGYHTVTPYIIASDAARLIEFLGKAFGAEVRHKTVEEGRIRHAEVRVGSSMVMISQSIPEYPPTPIHIYVYIEDCDAVFDRAVAAGGTVIMPMKDQDYGDRNGGVKDPVGNSWWIGKRIKEL